ncbi:somatostatin receptor type 2-like [Sitodiplosis mosellana]|uniref:somatostatin receptor type 2-like n=1 Tax=Sitodiplosis mosellana TaxID=263140 RepID=UPI002443905C|nr:somatostatin receptor type 2-like [Sitodiplosis mosellana]
MYSGNSSSTSSYFADYNGTTDISEELFSEFAVNTTNSSTYPDFDCPPNHMPMANIFFMVMYCCIGCVGLLGNTLVIYVVLREKRLQTVTNIYILNLAIADECFLIGIPFLIATMNMGHWVFGGAMCKAYLVSTSITQFTSSIFLFIMSADRYIAICHHISSPRFRTPCVSRVISLIAWCCSALIMLPIMIYANVLEQQNGRFTCAIIWPDSHSIIWPGLYSFTIYSLVLGFIIPLCFILLFYCLVIKKLRTVAKKTNRPKGKRRSHRKVTKLVLTVITVYIFCWLPYWVAQVSLINSPIEMCSTRLKVTLFLFVCWLSYSNSAMNPILYAFLSDSFKNSFLKACTCAATKDLDAQLKLEHSGIGMRRLRDRRTSESTQPTLTTRCQRVSELTTTVTTTTGTSNVPSRNPSPPIRLTNGSIQQHYFCSDETLGSGEVIAGNGQRIF